MNVDNDIAYESLIQLQNDGVIEMHNPMASQLLMPLSHDGDLLNLFNVLAPHAPGLRVRCQAFPAAHGVVWEGVSVMNI